MPLLHDSALIENHLSNGKNICTFLEKEEKSDEISELHFIKKLNHLLEIFELLQTEETQMNLEQLKRFNELRENKFIASANEVKEKLIINEERVKKTIQFVKEVKRYLILENRIHNFSILDKEEKLSKVGLIELLENLKQRDSILDEIEISAKELDPIEIIAEAKDQNVNYQQYIRMREPKNSFSEMLKKKYEATFYLINELNEEQIERLKIITKHMATFDLAEEYLSEPRIKRVTMIELAEHINKRKQALESLIQVDESGLKQCIEGLGINYETFQLIRKRAYQDNTADLVEKRANLRKILPLIEPLDSFTLATLKSFAYCSMHGFGKNDPNILWRHIKNKAPSITVDDLRILGINYSEPKRVESEKSQPGKSVSKFLQDLLFKKHRSTKQEKPMSLDAMQKKEPCDDISSSSTHAQTGSWSTISKNSLQRTVSDTNFFHRESIIQEDKYSAISGSQFTNR